MDRQGGRDHRRHRRARRLTRPERSAGAGVAGYLAGVALVTALAFRLELDVTVRAMLVLIPPLTMLVVDHRCRRRARGRMLVVTRPGRRIDARAVTRAAAQLGHPWASCEVVPGKTAGLFHLLLSVEG